MSKHDKTAQRIATNKGRSNFDNKGLHANVI